MSIALDIHIKQKRYGERTILRDLRLQLQEGEVVSLIGASGCGKSSLLSIASGLDREFSGEIKLDGKPLQGVSREIGFIFQEPRLFPWLTVAENVAFDSANALSSQRLVTRLLAEVGLQDQAHALPKQLSGGQAQRAAIARGLFTQPRVLLLDEPFSAVDAFTRMKLQDLLLKVAYQHKLTVLLVTHDIDEALYLSDRVVLLNGTLTEFTPGPAPRKRGDLEAAVLKAAILDSLHA
ncbi:ATP-binding cassette domain-containing protein [Duganella sp. FT80W]|uniref:ATP-binding cassette domain-containing protein n=1 Tax=Duganella guangzhouensis TaxID=2666084 RepID=A0A6I2L0X5_9BURK|nr:ABC transporter ATP-binding protein [Duganella guangzhouensis]MRW91995.1 ATP-binding cassette domain-containing protein [Duganella guangzhouensis]